MGVQFDRRPEEMSDSGSTPPASDAPDTSVPEVSVIPDTAFGAGSPPEPSMAWYVLRVASNKENQVRDSLVRKIKIEGLDERIGQVLVPTVKERRMRSGVPRVVERKLYPGYVFVEMACEADGSVPEGIWFLIKETSGVGDFIGSDGKPTSMPAQEVGQMLAASAESEDQPGLSGLNIAKGHQVKITDGAFESFEGEVEAVDERRGMVSVIVSIFGRSTPVEVEYWKLEKID
jgi:transcriptional antiterminator NusG